MTQSKSKIRFLVSSQIDREKWDRVVLDSPHAHVYSTSTYLDLFTTHWGGIVADDYTVVMAVPFKVKWGIRYCYTPVGVAQLGLFGKDITQHLELAFLDVLHQEFKYGRLHLGPAFSPAVAERYEMQWKDNFILPLNLPYEELYQNYTKDAKRNLRKAGEIEQIVTEDVTTEDIRKAFMFQYGDRGNTNRMSEEYNQFAENLNRLLEKGMAFKIGARTPDGQLLGATVFARFRNRLYYIFGAPTALGRSYQTSHVLIDAVIKRFSNSDLILDFEGSSIPSVAMFYKKFSPQNEPYPLYHFNQLPWPLRLLKK
jgi:hypothetical protein